MSKVSMDSKIEEKLIKKCKKDKEAFGTLYKHYKDPILNFVRLKVETLETAEDLTSTIFQKAFESIETFNWQGISFSSWLYRIARNTIIDHYRSKKQNISIDNIELISKEKGPEELAVDIDFEDRLKNVLKNLPERERQIIYMKFFEGYTNKTISKLTNLSETNVGTIIYRAMARLKEDLLHF